VTLRLSEGGYRFRADKNGTQFWSGEANHCAVPLCSSAVVTDAEGAVTRYSYDGLDRLISIQYPDSSVQYAYDAVGSRTAMIDTLGTTPLRLRRPVPLGECH
jgi:YD repeat-containing protein